MEGQGTSTLAHDYEFFDKALNGLNGVVYCSVFKQTDFDGEINFSPVVSVRLGGDIAGVQAYPNPFVDKLNVDLSNWENADAEIRLFDAAGRQVFYGVTSASSFALETGNLADGIYCLEVKGNGLLMKEIIVKSIQKRTWYVSKLNHF